MVARVCKGLARVGASVACLLTLRGDPAAGAHAVETRAAVGFVFVRQKAALACGDEALVAGVEAGEAGVGDLARVVTRHT